VATYRNPDEERVAIAERERIAREEAARLERLAEEAAVAAMKARLRWGTGSPAPRRVVAGFAIPAGCLGVAFVAGPGVIRTLAGWIALLSGSGLGLASIVVALGALLARTGTASSTTTGIFAGLALVAWSVFAAILIVSAGSGL
jgi:hypothetical protein